MLLFHSGLVDRRAFDDTQIRRVYHKAIRLVHPDKLSGASSGGGGATGGGSEHPAAAAADDDDDSGLEAIHTKVLAQKIFSVLAEANRQWSAEI